MGGMIANNQNGNANNLNTVPSLATAKVGVIRTVIAMGAEAMMVAVATTVTRATVAMTVENAPPILSLLLWHRRKKRRHLFLPNQ